MAYNHHIERVSPGLFRLSWTIDGKVAGSRLRYPRTTTRLTDAEGAARFAKKWRLPVPAELQESNRAPD